VWWSFFLQIFYYFLLSFPSFLFGNISYFNQFKIQSNKSVTLLDQWNVLKTVFFAKTTMILPTAIIGYAILQYFHYDLPYDFQSMPSWSVLLIRLIASLWIEDTWHYFCHRLLHHPSIYGYIHKVHHTYTAPFALAAEYAHPMETFILAIGF